VDFVYLFVFIPIPITINLDFSGFSDLSSHGDFLSNDKYHKSDVSVRLSLCRLYPLYKRIPRATVTEFTGRRSKSV
jgi:hypothetical protein